MIIFNRSAGEFTILSFDNKMDIFSSSFHTSSLYHTETFHSPYKMLVALAFNMYWKMIIFMIIKMIILQLFYDYLGIP